MIPSEFTVLLEATLRALIAAFAVWAGLRLLRVKNVPAQKAAWGLMLVAALAMPLLMRWQLVPAWAAVNLPIPSLQKMAGPAPVDMRFLAQPSPPAPVAAISFSGEPGTIARPHSEVREAFPAPAGQIRRANRARFADRVRSSDRVHSAPVNKIEAAPSSPALAQSRCRACSSTCDWSQSANCRADRTVEHQTAAFSRLPGFSTSAFALHCSSGFSWAWLRRSESGWTQNLWQR